MPDYLTYYRRTRHPGYIIGVQPPLRIPSTNLILWLQASAITGLNDGDAISTWPDSSGNGYNATASSTARPTYKVNILNGCAVARFDGSNDELNIAGIGAAVPSAAHLFIVATMDNSDTQYNLYNHGNVDSWWRFNANGYVGCFRSARIDNYPATMPTTGSHRFEIQSSSSNYEFFLDGTSKGAQAAAYQAGTNHTIGRPDNTDGLKFFKGDIAEIILYSAIQGSTDRTAINTHLTSKYGI